LGIPFNAFLFHFTSYQRLAFLTGLEEMHSVKKYIVSLFFCFSDINLKMAYGRVIYTTPG